jgi:hypothetical protein
MIFIAAELFVQTLTHSVAFLKEKHITLTNDAWRVAIDCDMSPYE